jgi:hypothetical protein
VRLAFRSEILRMAQKNPVDSNHGSHRESSTPCAKTECFGAAAADGKAELGGASLAK